MMQYEIIDSPLEVRLIGRSGSVSSRQYGEKGMALMEELYGQIEHIGLSGYGQNHWVYLAEDRMYTGVAWTDLDTDTGTLEKMQLRIPRYLRHVHIGPYDKLPEVWDQLIKQLTADGLDWNFPSLERYGHWDEDPSKLETEVLIGLRG